MHFKTFVILSCGLATFASVIPVNNVVDTVIDTVKGVAGQLVEDPMPLVHPPKSCTTKERRQILSLQGQISNLRARDIAAISKYVEKNRWVYGKYHGIEEAPAEYQKDLPYEGEPTTCEELRDLTKVYNRLKSGKNLYLMNGMHIDIDVANREEVVEGVSDLPVGSNWDDYIDYAIKSGP